MADAIVLDRDQEVAPTENTLGGHSLRQAQASRGPPHQGSRAWGKFDISYSMPFAYWILTTALSATH
jgi:hypothetical protein